MKYIILLLLTGLVACGTKKGTPFLLEGNLKNTNAKTVYLEESGPGLTRPVVIDSAKLDAGGNFKMDPLLQEESLFSLRAGENEYPFALLVNDSKKIRVESDLSTMGYTVSGSKGSQEIIDFNTNLRERGRRLSDMGRQFDSLSKPADPAVKKINDSIQSQLIVQYENLAKDTKEYVKDFMERTSSPSVLVYAYELLQQVFREFQLSGFNRVETAEIVNKASSRFPDHAAIMEWKKKAGSTRAPDFSLPDTSGNHVSLSSFKGKYVLVDFWASWCKPCRDENPNVVNAFNRFRDRNFTILGVSLDQNKGAWVKAIADDSLRWTHISDLKYWQSEAAALYEVRGIPYNFLIDPNGNIVAENIRGPELHATLDRLLK